MIGSRKQQPMRCAAGLGLSAVLYFVAAGIAPLVGAAGNAAPAAEIIELRLADVILPVPAEYVSQGIEEAARRKASLVLITVDTPGGLDSSMRQIIQRIINSPVPVAVYVGPSGSRAASAGFYILLSADVAAMAPGTHTGAASPVLINILTGGVAKSDETMQRKIFNDATAYLRSIVGKRGRNVADAETAVTEARAFTAEESLKRNLIDLIANSPEELLAQLNGREVKRFDGTTVKLQLDNAVRTPLEMSAKQRWLGRIAQPDVLFVLIILGLLGLYVEFTHPGLILPGVVGGVCVVLALMAMRILPVNAVGVVLILLGVVLFVLEAKYTSYGLLGLGGAVSMVVGALMLIESPLTPMGVSLGVAVGVTLPFAVIAVFLMQLVIKSRKWKPSMGKEVLLGSVGEVTETIEARTSAGYTGKGMVFVQGELWRAVSTQQIAEGASVRVVKVDGLTLHVEPAEGQAATPGVAAS
jgi:membrane-bound serine protease (ClpP class)